MIREGKVRTMLGLLRVKNKSEGPRQRNYQTRRFHRSWMGDEELQSLWPHRY